MQVWQERAFRRARLSKHYVEAVAVTVIVTEAGTVVADIVVGGMVTLRLTLASVLGEVAYLISFPAKQSHSPTLRYLRGQLQQKAEAAGEVAAQPSQPLRSGPVIP
jgi:hypothetical protein